MYGNVFKWDSFSKRLFRWGVVIFNFKGSFRFKFGVIFYFFNSIKGIFSYGSKLECRSYEGGDV